MKKIALIASLFCAPLSAADNNNGAGGPFHGLAHRGENPVLAAEAMWGEYMQTIPAWKRATALGLITAGTYIALSGGSMPSLWDPQGNFNIMLIFK